jgi:tetratricopeptide (TPR) repeat protein
MSRVFLRLVLLGVIGSAAVPARVLAQPAPTSAVDKKKAAKQYTEAGLTAAKLADYDTAIGFYEKAYSLMPHPTLLFNIAEAQRLAGRIDVALSLYQRYLSDAPNGPLARDARDQIAEIEASKAAEARKAEDERLAAERRRADERKAAEARKAEDARLAEQARKADEARLARERAAAVAASPPDTGSTEAAAKRWHDLRIAGIATAAGGGVALAIGAGFGLHARTLSNELSKPHATYTTSKVDAGHRANTIAIVGMAGGTALVAAGAALYGWGYAHGRSTERVSLAPIASDRLAGMAVTGTWP